MTSVATSLSHVGQLLYFMAPAFAANMAPPFVRYWKGWNRPISQRWLGEHKTIIGFALGVVAAVMVTFIQSRAAWPAALAISEYWATLGLRFGIGAMAGDSVKSLVKRRLGIAPGRRWFPWDQLDFVLGALVFVWGSATLSSVDVATIVLLSVAGHIVVNHLGYWLGIRDQRW